MTTAKTDQTGRESLAATTAPVARVPPFAPELICGYRTVSHACLCFSVLPRTQLPNVALFNIRAEFVESHRAPGFRFHGSLMPVACIGFRLVFQHPVTVKGKLMPKRIRLACSECDTDEGDEVSSIPTTWKDVTEVQSLAESRKTVTEDDKTRSAFEWYTHLGICPQCQKEDD